MPASALDQPLAQAALAAQAALDAAHPAAVALVIVAEQVQQAVEREDAQLGQLGVARRARLTPRDAARDDDVAQKGTGAPCQGFVAGKATAGNSSTSVA